MVTRFLWQCADCKMCEVCLSNENEETMLICDACDRAFHMECLSPPVQEVPEGDWFCKGCGYCSSCGCQLTEDEALDPSCFYSNRHRICVACKEKYLRVKRGRSPYRSNTAFDSVYAACSKRNNPNKLCEVCAAPLESDSKGPQKRIFCAVCRIGVHVECAVARQAPDEYICKICSDFIEDFQAETDRSTATHARHPTLMALENVAT
ncbi:PHD-finger domain-containing protein, putative [Eimeria necatrix]|uniref:PHD-finger domain-containing protein, putative n=1 Tax=Eimeria necatrix TaxID=51315 RepID=U6MLM3_9EIME|nr:PHD-finger domain-containing protein, putative [Eimeria necatrix]CDJ65122.1 PHD-finger domain-containing protein, putative [Eimeria necatrix]